MNDVCNLSNFLIVGSVYLRFYDILECLMTCASENCAAFADFAGVQGNCQN